MNAVSGFTHYTAVEGGDWLPWTGGNGSDLDGRTLRKRGKTTVEICGVMLHALKDADGRVWDCINGWRELSQCKECGRKEGEGHYDDCPVGMGVLPNPDPGRFDAGLTRIAEKHAKALVAQEYALRVWNGQSVDVPRHIKIERVKRALEGQNLPFEGVELP